MLGGQHIVRSITDCSPLSAVAQIHELRSHIDRVNVFCIFKCDLVERIMTGRVLWKELVETLSLHSLQVVWCMRPIYLNAVFWEVHYQWTIEQKELKEPGSGQRYLKKIIDRLGDTYGMPVLLRLMTDELEDAENLRARKYQLREHLSALPSVQGCNTTRLIHISDDWKSAIHELGNLESYISTNPDTFNPPNTLLVPTTVPNTESPNTNLSESEGRPPSADTNLVKMWLSLRELVESASTNPASLTS